MSAARCKSCGAPILWGHTRNGRRIPIDPWEDPAGNLATHLVAGVLMARVITPDASPEPGDIRRVPHFATCPARGPRGPRPRPQPTLPTDEPTLEGM